MTTGALAVDVVPEVAVLQPAPVKTITVATAAAVTPNDPASTVQRCARATFSRSC
jgi:hypothetical protein